ncbi:MAG: hypothetical protein U5K75_12085 [Ahrensia sp.]|nr:hypothetical protein [Ahrensia sp.]
MTETSGPPVDITGAVRSNPTQIGAYHGKVTTGSSRANIAYNGGLTIGLAPVGRTGILFITDGSWTYTDWRETLRY